MDPKTRANIQDFIKVNGGVVKTGVFQKAGFHNSYLAELMREGVLVRLKSGLYISAESQSVSGFYETLLALPKAVICLASALAFYELTTYEPPAVHVAIPRNDRTLPPEYPPVRIFSFSGQRFSIGQSLINIENHEISIYDREKTICDIIRFRRIIGQDIVNEALRNYLHGPQSAPDKLIRYARQLKVEGPVLNHLRLIS
jgi:predicted transcriptional regulator of viral defense system